MFSTYGALFDCYENISLEKFEDKDFKYKFNKFLLPTRLKNLVGKAKTRAQNGDNHGGLLGVFHRNGINSETLQNLFCEIYKVSTSDLKILSSAEDIGIKNNVWNNRFRFK